MYEVRLTGGGGGKDAFARIMMVNEDFRPRSFWGELVRIVIHPWFLKTARQNLAGQGNLAGESWNYATEPIYAAYKARMVGPSRATRVMRWSPGMERLQPGLTDPDSQWHIFKLRDLSVRIGVGLPYALRLTKGGIGPFGEPFPGRSLMPSRTIQKMKLEKAILKWMKARFPDYRKFRVDQGSEWKGGNSL